MGDSDKQNDTSLSSNESPDGSSSMSETFPLFPRMPTDLNTDVLQIHDFAEQQRELLDYLEILRKRSGRQPIWLIEHKKCFTNVAMRKTLTKILGGSRNFGKYVVTYTIDPSVYEYPIPEDDSIFILGGSVNDTYDEFGHDFTNRFSLPLLNKTQRSTRIRVLGICFGHQSLVESYGKIVDVPIKTIKQSFQLGFYPLNFHSSQHHPAFRYLDSIFPRAVVFTRSGYPKRTDQKPAIDIPGLNVFARFSDILRFFTYRDGLYIPPGVSYLKDEQTGSDKVVSFQGHPEIRPTKVNVQPIIDFINLMRDELTNIVPPLAPLQLSRRKNLKPIADSFFIPLLHQFAREISVL